LFASSESLISIENMDNSVSPPPLLSAILSVTVLFAKARSDKEALSAPPSVALL